MRRSIRFALSIAFLALTAAPARAALIVYDMFGTVGPNFEGENLLEGLGIFVGDPVHLTVGVDTKAPDLCGQPGKGFYALPFAAVEVSGMTFPPVHDPGGFVEVNTGPFGNCEFPGDEGTGTAVRLFAGPFGFDMTLFGLSQDGEALPVPLFATDFVEGYFGIGNEFAGVTFVDIRVREVVPEPATLLLLGGGLGVLTIRRRRNR